MNDNDAMVQQFHRTSPDNHKRRKIDPDLIGNNVHITDLCYDILLVIFGHLDQWDIVYLKSTCKFFHHVISKELKMPIRALTVGALNSVSRNCHNNYFYKTSPESIKTFVNNNNFLRENSYVNDLYFDHVKNLLAVHPSVLGTEKSNNPVMSFICNYLETNCDRNKLWAFSKVILQQGHILLFDLFCRKFVIGDHKHKCSRSHDNYIDVLTAYSAKCILSDTRVMWNYMVHLLRELNDACDHHDHERLNAQLLWRFLGEGHFFDESFVTNKSWGSMILALADYMHKEKLEDFGIGQERRLWNPYTYRHDQVSDGFINGLSYLCNFLRENRGVTVSVESILAIAVAVCTK